MEQDKSEVVNVIEVKKKKQRVNDNYIDIDDDNGEDDDYYDEEEYDDEFGADAMDDFDIEMMTGLSQNLLYLISESEGQQPNGRRGENIY